MVGLMSDLLNLYRNSSVEKISNGLAHVDELNLKHRVGVHENPR